MRILFVSNGHGEAAIADRIAVEVRAMAADAQLDHLPLVGETMPDTMLEVGPRKAMPSGGLIAMGNVRNLVADLRAGLLPLVTKQRKFLRSVRGSYDAAVAVGDAYAMAMTLNARAPTIFVGTAKSASVAPYGALERRLIGRARRRFVRDEPTAQALQRRGVSVDPAANVIVDLFHTDDDAGVDPAIAAFSPLLVLLPGSRESAYDDARFLLRIVRKIALLQPGLGAVLSVARGLDAARFASEAESDGWDALPGQREHVPFVLTLRGRAVVAAWTGALGPLLRRATIVLGQAGTANEGAASAGVPVVAFSRESDERARWYRRRQQGLLGDALAVLSGDHSEAANGVLEILDDAERRGRMSEIGRVRMGAAGGARRIAAAILEVAASG